MPKTLGSIYPERTAFLLGGIIGGFAILLSPFVFIFTQFSHLITRIMRIPLDTPDVSFTEEEIKTFIDIGEEEGVLEPGEKTMMHRVFAFTDLAAGDIMTPRTKIVPVPLSTSYRDVLELAERTRFSCFPVCKAGQDTDECNIDDVAGVLYIKDMLALPDSGGIAKREFSVKDTMREPIFIPGTKKMSAVQQILRAQNQSLAIVIDEYSGTSGLLTTADLAASIFGMFPDDTGAPQPPVAKINEHELLVDGSCRLSALSEIEGIRLVSKYYETVGGFMMEKCDRIPQIGDTVTESGCTFTVTQVSKNKVQRVHILRGAP
jgi:CBS domain containing-hemolysin-like protein